MTRYYFDVGDNAVSFEDDLGIDLPGLADAMRLADDTLTGFVREILPGGDRKVTVTVRDELGNSICSKRLIIRPVCLDVIQP